MKKKSLVLTVLAALLVLGGVFGGILANATNVDRSFGMSGENWSAVIVPNCEGLRLNGLRARIQNRTSGAASGERTFTQSSSIGCAWANRIASDTIRVRVGETARGHYSYRVTATDRWSSVTTRDLTR